MFKANNNPPVIGGMKGRHKKSLIRVLKPYLFLTPILIFVILFSYYPFLKTFIFSLYKVNVAGELTRFVGFDNYINLWKRPDFVNSILVSLKFAAMFVPLAVIVPLLLALVADKPKFMTKFYQTSYALPMAVSMSATCLIFEQLLHRRVGLLNYLLDKLGIYENMTAIDWLNNSTWALPAIVLIFVWTGIGFDFMLLLAAVRNVPNELLEAASLEGAGYWRKVFTVVLPTISPTLFFVICTQMIKGLTMAGPVMILTGGGPLGATSTMIYYVYTTGFRSTNYAVGSTASVIAFLITFVFLLFNFIYEKKGVNYD
jgi:sn-glycerol 3-phosphate transport system permease protein